MAEAVGGGAVAAVCSVCGLEKGRYRCPACAVVSCSVGCSKRHKAESQCTGARKATEFVRRSGYTQRHFDSDYNFLTGVERDLDNAARQQLASPSSKRGAGGPARNDKQAQKWADHVLAKAGVRVRLAPAGLRRHADNRSAWIQQRSCFRWTVEWIFARQYGAPERVVVLSHAVLETATIDEALKSLLVRRDVREVLALGETTTIAAHIADQPGRESTVRHFPGTALLRDVLSDCTIEEYPTIHITPHNDENDTPEAAIEKVPDAIDALLRSIPEVRTREPPQPSVDTAAASTTADFVSLGRYDSEDDSAEPVLPAVPGSLFGLF